MFKPGESGNPAGRPVGAKDKKWATLQFWFERIIESLKDESLKPAERLNAELRIAELILARKKLPAEDPDESKRNADETFQNLKKLQDDARRGATVRSE